jgi:hypothetical protein
MRASLLLCLALSLAACGSSQPEPHGGGGGSSGSGGSSEPIVIDPPPPTSDVVVGEDACTTDADCVPAGCCHADACVARANAPSCGDVMCTTECRYGTLDCGGGCLCEAGRCAARLSQAPDIQVSGSESAPQ